MKYFKKQFYDGLFYYKVKKDNTFWFMLPDKKQWIQPQCKWNKESTEVCIELTPKEMFIEIL